MIKLMADSTCDLSQEIVERYNIGVTPLNIEIKGVNYRDKIDLSQMNFLNACLTWKNCLRRERPVLKRI